jgi:hypothetical protein
MIPATLPSLSEVRLTGKAFPMQRSLFALSFGFVALLFAMGQAHAAPQCGPRAAVMAHLAERYGETRQAIGMAANAMVMEVFASAESQSWTITITTAEGQTCLVASGEGYETLTEALPAQGDPA